MRAYAFDDDVENTLRDRRHIVDSTAGDEGIDDPDPSLWDDRPQSAPDDVRHGPLRR